MKNKILLIIAVAMLPIVVISFVFKNSETNFNLKKKYDSEESGDIEYDANQKDENEINNEFEFRVLVNGKITNISMDDYIIGVVAGEMPASFDSEALKAQAVASRTYAVYKKNSNINGEFDLTDNKNNQVYLTLDDMKKKWGDEFEKYYNKIKEAVLETKDEVITFNGNIIEAFYFAMSAGTTEEATTVFKEDRDYLKSVESIYDNNSLNNYEVTKSFSINEFKTKLGLQCDSIIVDSINSNDAGYVNEISVCTKNFGGTDFRKLLDLRSTNFKINIIDKVEITTKGYGHGVGMSQYGANGYANHGYSYHDILKHYYTGVEITKLNVLF